MLDKMRPASRSVASRLLRKDGLVAVQVARDLLARSPGDRIPRVSDYSRKFRTGYGTVQAALRLLGQLKAITLESRGQLGTYLTSVDYGRLWEVGGLGAIMGLMPLPYSLRYEGLATGLHESFRRAKVPFSLGYMRGAQNRVDALHQGKCDFVVLSRFAAEADPGQDLQIVCNLGPLTYVAQHAILCRQAGYSGIRDGMRVGIDYRSPDQARLTEQECAGKDVSFVEVSYTQIIDKLRNAEIDVAVWNADEVIARFAEVYVVPLQAACVDTANTEAVIAVLQEREDLANILRHALDSDLVKCVQQEVLAGRRLPSY